LRQVAKNLKFKHTDMFVFLDDNEFCTAFLCARADTFRKLANYVVIDFDYLTEVCDHHAGIQFLISYIAHLFFEVKIVSNVFQVGDWYEKDYKFSQKNGQLLLDDEAVVFNHTKFSTKYK